MERSELEESPSVPDTGTEIHGAPAHRDADAILARVRADEVEADQARERYRSQPIAPIEPDDRIAVLLEPGERVVAIRRSVQLERRQTRSGVAQAAGLAGNLYLTSGRLILVGRAGLSLKLDDIEDAMVSGERLLLAMRDGRGIALDVSRPRLLRVEIAAARNLSAR